MECFKLVVKCSDVTSVQKKDVADNVNPFDVLRVSRQRALSKLINNIFPEKLRQQNYKEKTSVTPGTKTLTRQKAVMACL
jgi:hypothetical protein